MLSFFDISLQLGLAYALVAYGIYISFRVLDFPDLTVDGSFTLGGALSAVIITRGLDPIMALVGAALGGFLAGCFTCSLYSFLRINKILSGILALTILYSINLRVMGAPNIPLLRLITITDWISRMSAISSGPIICYGLIAVAMKLSVDWLLRTEVGLLVRATGDNEQVVKCIAKNPEVFRILGMGMANMLVAMAGSLLAQNFGFADINLGVGVIIVGFGSLLLGEAIIRPTTVRGFTSAALIGSVLYQGVVSLGLRMGLAPTDLKLATGLMVIVLLAIRRRRQ